MNSAAPRRRGVLCMARTTVRAWKAKNREKRLKMAENALPNTDFRPKTSKSGEIRLQPVKIVPKIAGWSGAEGQWPRTGGAEVDSKACSSVL